MQSRKRKNPLAGGIQIFTQGQFWPIGLVAIDEFEACLLIPDALVLSERERVTLKIGDFPSFPAVVRSVAGDTVRLLFLGAIHPKVIALLELDNFEEPRVEKIAA